MTSLLDINFPKDTLEISVEEYVQLFEDPDSHQLLDVREPWEVEIAHLENSMRIPLGVLEKEKNQLSSKHWIVVYCHHGVRSLRACHLLREKGFDKVLSVKGGIHRWSQIIDSSIPTYLDTKKDT